jgi:predicted RNase H-like nuclease (RuvC/YqgF family)
MKVYTPAMVLPQEYVTVGYLNEVLATRFGETYDLINKLATTMDARFEKLESRMEHMIGNLENKITMLAADLHEFRTDMTAKVKKHDIKFEDLESRVIRLEK